MKKKFLLLLLLLCCFYMQCGSSSTGPTVFSIGDNDPSVIVGFGDSITYGRDSEVGGYLAWLQYYLDQDNSGITAYNEGVPGTTTTEGIQRINDVLETYRPAVIMIMYGTNDQYLGFPKEKSLTYNNLLYMVSAARENDTIPILATMPYACYDYEFMADDVEEMNEMIRDMAREYEIVLADVYEAFSFNGGCELMHDYQGNHPNDDGYQLIADVFYSSLQQISW